jgi:type IV pilus assembly protein PilO
MATASKPAKASTSAKLDTFISEKYIPLDKKIKILVAVALFVLPVVLFYFLFYAPNLKKITLLEGQKKTLTADVNKAKKAAKNLKKHKAELEQTKQYFEKIAVVLPKKKEIPKLLRNISDLGKSAGLDFVSFAPGSEIPKEFYAEIPINISISGPYHNMGYFLDQVSKLDRIVTVNNITMGSPKKEAGEMVLSSTCRLVTYRFTNTSTQPKGKNKKK